MITKEQKEKHQFDELSKQVIGLAMEVHKQLGPGLLESTYQSCLALELEKAGLHYEMEKPIDILYKQQKVESAFRVDFIIEDSLIVELKSVEALSGIHVAQVLTYMKLTGIKIGLLLNFNVLILKDGIKRLVL